MKWILVPAAMIVAAVVASSALALSFGPWGAAVNAESFSGASADLNTAFQDGCPIESPDGLSLYIASNRPGGKGGLDIWVATRPNKNAPFGKPENAGEPFNSSADDFCPSPMANGWFFFVSTRPGGCGGPDVYATRKAGEGWWQAVHLSCSVNSAAGDWSPYLLTLKNGKSLLYISSDRPGGFAPDVGTPDHDLYVSPLTPLGFARARLVPGLNTEKNDARPNLRQDGLEIVFDSDRPGTLGGQDVYRATRAKVTDRWSAPVNLGPTINTPAGESRASLSWDGTRLYFGSSRPGIEGVGDVFVATRSRTG